MAFTQPSRLASLKLAYAWRYTFSPNNNLNSLLALSASTLNQLSVQIDTDEDVNLLLGALPVANLSLGTLSLVLKTDVPNPAALVDAFPTIDTLTLECADLALVRELLDTLDPAVKLRRLVLNLRASLAKSAEALQRWLALPSLAGLEVLVVRGSRSKFVALSDEGKAVVDAARARGIKQVFLRKG